MDAADDAQAIVDDSLAQGRIPVIDINPRADKDRKAEILAERARRAVVNIPDRDDELYKIRTVAERANARLKDEFGAQNLRVRGHAKACGQGLELKRRTSASAARAATPNIRWQNALA